MYRFSVSSALALGLILIVAPAFAASSHTAHKSGAVRRVGHRIRHRIAHPLGQRAIAPERATQIQTALIRKNYLTGSPSGQWDAQIFTNDRSALKEALSRDVSHESAYKPERTISPLQEDVAQSPQPTHPRGMEVGIGV